MSKIIFESDRYFQLHDYSNSHGQLLLRSSKHDAFKTNIDIIFFDTNFIQLAADLEKISISKVEGFKSRFSSKLALKYLSYENSNLFEILSNGEKYYIAASFFHVYENELGFRDTSLDYDEIGQAKRIASSYKK